MSNLCEPPGADPHAGWCGGWGRKTPGYPMVLYVIVRAWKRQMHENSVKTYSMLCANK